MTHADLLFLTAARDLCASGRARRIRLAAGLSQAEIAAAVGVSSFAVSRWERGERRPYGPSGAAYGRLLRDLVGDA